MHARLRVLILVLAVVAGHVACAGPEAIETTLTLWNRTETPLLEVRVHETSRYLDAPNVLTEPLADNASVELDFVPREYVTVIRRRVELADPVAYTTDRGLDEVDGPGYTLIVLERSFRLQLPVR